MSTGVTQKTTTSGPSHGIQALLVQQLDSLDVDYRRYYRILTEKSSKTALRGNTVFTAPKLPPLRMDGPLPEAHSYRFR